MRKFFKRHLLATVATVGFSAAALAATWTLNLPAVGPGTTSLSSGLSVTNYPYLLGNETVPTDTNLPSGAQPQSIAPTVFQIASVAAATQAHTATESGGAATLNTWLGDITSASQTTAAGSTYTLTLTDSVITATSVVQAMAYLGTSTQGQLTITSITPASGSVVIVVKNTGTRALNGTLHVIFSAGPVQASN